MLNKIIGASMLIVNIACIKPTLIMLLTNDTYTAIAMGLMLVLLADNIKDCITLILKEDDK